MSNPVTNTLKMLGAMKHIALDGLENVLTGLGVAGKDKRLGGDYKYIRQTQASLESFHDSSDIGHLVVNKVPELATKKWLTHSIDKEDGGIDLVNELVKEDKRLQVKKKFKQAMAWANLYGGSGIYVSVDDGLEPSEPINPNRIVKFNSLTVLHKFELQRGELNKDIDDPNFGLPDTYMISGRVVADVPTIHHSRIIRFDGPVLSEQGFTQNDYWNDSVLTVLRQIAIDYESAYNGVFHALQDFDLDVVKIKNLADICGGDDDNLLLARLRLMQLSKSIMSSIMIDAEDEGFEKLERAFANVDKVLDKCDKRLQMATKLPHTLLFGEGSTGTLGAGGESEQGTLNDLVAGVQDTSLRDQFEEYGKLIQLAKQGPTNGKLIPSWSFTFNKLNEPTEKQVAEVRKLVAESDKMYWEMGALSSEEISESRFGGENYSMETDIDLESREEQGKTAKIENEEAENELKKMEQDQDSFVIQTLIFSKEKFTKKEAINWAKDNNFKHGSIDETEESFRLRQRNPDDFIRMRTIEIKKGIKAVGGPLKK